MTSFPCPGREQHFAAEGAPGGCLRRANPGTWRDPWRVHHGAPTNCARHCAICDAESPSKTDWRCTTSVVCRSQRDFVLSIRVKVTRISEVSPIARSPMQKQVEIGRSRYFTWLD